MVSEARWTEGGLVLRRAALRAVEEDAIRGYLRDEEACGYLVGPEAEPLVVDEHVRMENLANKLHALDPEQYFRTGRMYFAFNEKRFDDAVTRGARAGRPVKVLYHSHLDAGAYFSPTDAAVMSSGEPPAVEGGPITMGPGPAWPLAFLVTSVRGGSAPLIAEHRLFVWDGAGFVPSTFSVMD
ncbi:MAG TPA: Mov34/MPN/PAD-1 family protein [Candidatus Nanopelagicales bacterium]|nr:Mov34/MPN/PAD-1 family protein [Candidatus Nanopelagicales bacterium]